jgi:peroxiredoxin (alkyl hydroperoxide reductase subunit C)
MTVVQAGQPAPAFSLARDGGERFTRADLQGRRTLLVFYPYAFSPVCTSQLSVYHELLGDFEEHGVTVYGVSCDSVWAQRAFKEQLGIAIEQLSDFEPKGAACRAFGVLHPGGFPQRALVLVGPDGAVLWSYEAPSPGDLPGANLIFDALDRLGAGRPAS